MLLIIIISRLVRIISSSVLLKCWLLWVLVWKMMM